MGSFGEHLRRERETRGISLDEIVATTKIGRRLLTALEDEQFDLLPGGIFNKAYVRAYAKCVGMDEDATVAEYLQAAHEAPPDTRVIAQQHASIHSSRSSERNGFPVAPVLILVVVIAGGIGGWKLYQDHQKERQARAVEVPPASESTGQSPATSSASPASSVPANSQAYTSHEGAVASPAGKASEQVPTSTTKPVVSSPAAVARSTAPQSSATSTSAGAFEVVVRPRSTAWVSIKADGQVVVRGIIKPPDVKTIHANNQVVFFTGNAAAVEVSFNGKNVPLAGGMNEEQTLVFDARGITPPAEAKTGPQ